MEEDEGAVREDTLRRQGEKKRSRREIGITPHMETNSFTSLPFKLTSFQRYSWKCCSEEEGLKVTQLPLL